MVGINTAYRAVTLNNGSVAAIQALLEHLDRKALQMKDLTWVDDDSFLFAGKNPSKPLTVPYLNNLVKDWCRRSTPYTRHLNCERSEQWVLIVFENRTVLILGAVASNDDSEGVLLVADDVGNIIWRVAPDTRAN